ncbi:hypothetical protein AQ616_18755 [Oceanobacillus sp. E9]|uniref:hypothetical protein n=1 Tax=Oceanobacillus sp. E9 TaxID=1742575 RepID=UPI00084E54F1|nr:hypothetical protein [Oceanobacillus sp. E9]OEH52946.1 hypothetical protein AQ616_18755 [Oceanobacillus sp. E9]
MSKRLYTSRKDSNFIKSMDEDVRKEYLIRKIAMLNVEQLEPYIEIVSNDKNFRTIEYAVNLPMEG